MGEVGYRSRYKPVQRWQQEFEYNQSVRRGGSLHQVQRGAINTLRPVKAREAWSAAGEQGAVRKPYGRRKEG